MSEALRVEQDHHRLVLELPMHREPARRWLAVLLGILAIVFYVPAEPASAALAAAILCCLGLYAQDRRRASIELSHDELALHVTRFGRPFRVSAPWDAVELGVELASPRTLSVQLAGRPYSLRWNGSRADLEELYAALEEGRERFEPGAAAIPPEPESLAAMRGREDQSG